MPAYWLLDDSSSPGERPERHALGHPVGEHQRGVGALLEDDDQRDDQADDEADDPEQVEPG